MSVHAGMATVVVSVNADAAGGKAWATPIKADQEPISVPRIFGHARWRKDWVKVSSDLAQDRRARGASVRDVVNAVGDAGSTRPG